MDVSGPVRIQEQNRTSHWPPMTVTADTSSYIGNRLWPYATPSHLSVSLHGPPRRRGRRAGGGASRRPPAGGRLPGEGRSPRGPAARASPAAPRAPHIGGGGVRRQLGGGRRRVKVRRRGNTTSPTSDIPFAARLSSAGAHGGDSPPLGSMRHDGLLRQGSRAGAPPPVHALQRRRDEGRRAMAVTERLALSTRAGAHGRLYA
jgi:hypothetical protein